MGTFEVDPSERKKAIPAGEYTVAVIAAEVMDPKGKPKEGDEPKYQYVQVDFIVQEGEFKGETFMDMFSLSPKARPRLATFVTELGLVAPGTKGNMSFDTNEMLGRELIVKGKIEEFGGMERFRPTSFKAIAPAAGGDAAGGAAAPSTPQAAPAAPAASAPPARPAAAAPPARPAAPARRPV